MLGAKAGEIRSCQLVKGAFSFAKEVGLHPIINGSPLTGWKQGDGIFIFMLWQNHFNGRPGGG